MVDSAKITLKAGDGGNGKLNFLRTKYNPRGGPDGGNGGKGGDIYLECTHRINTLSLFRTQKMFKATNGEVGGNNYKSGKGAQDLTLQVPLGTVVTSRGVVIYDLAVDGQKELILKGGFGGLGNAHFKSSVNKNPMQATKGKKGEQLEIELELKLISNIGFIGFPSVGKSTLLNYLVKSNYKTASYPFTTLSPNLGVLHLKGDRSLILADLPGLIEGASIGKGLGDEFLKHVERCAVLVHLLDFTRIENFQSLIEDKNPKIIEDLTNDYKVIKRELEVWNKNLLQKKELVLLTKIDEITDQETRDFLIKSLSKNLHTQVLGISAYTGEGSEALIEYLDKNYDEIIQESKKSFKKVKKIKSIEITLKNIPNKRLVARTKSF